MSLTTSPTKRQQVIDEIAENIRIGMLHPGERLATVRDMSAHFDVSVSVVQNALRELSNNGFIECRGATGFYVRENSAAEKKDAPVPVSGKGRIFLSAMHHSDLVWRYPYEEYKKIRDKQITNELFLAEKYNQFIFNFEQSEMVRIYLKDHPDALPQMRKLLKDGRLGFFGGLCIPDLNMISGESIAMNLAIGRSDYQNIFGAKPDIACLFDAFGMCAQLPQILVKSGYSYLLPGRMPNKPAGTPENGPFLWTAPDGTAITVSATTANVTHLGWETNVPVIYPAPNQLARNISTLRYLEKDSLVLYFTEESVIQEDLFWIIPEVNRNAGKRVEFGPVRDYFQTVASKDLPECSGEFNPVFTGCYTTRISVKQKLRTAENLLFKAECLNVLMNTDFDSIPLWRELILSEFHDAACGCHTDKANVQIVAKLDSVIAGAKAAFPKGSGGGVCVGDFSGSAELQPAETPFPPKGTVSQKTSRGTYCFIDSFPPFGFKHYEESAKDPEPAVETKAVFATDHFSVDFSSAANPVIRNLSGRNVFPETGFGEILFRADSGSMWHEKYTGAIRGAEFQEERLVSVTEGGVFFTAITEGKILPGPTYAGNLGNHWYGFESLSFRKEYIFPKNLDWFKLKLTLEWHGCGTKIFIRFPVGINVFEQVATYETPFGTISRKPYFEIPCEFESTSRKLSSDRDYSQASGDWPALNWVNCSDTKAGLTIANTGTPGHQITAGNMIVSLLRSGIEIADGEMAPQPGSYVNGTHEFEFAFRAHSPNEMAKGLALGTMLNRPPEVIAGNVPGGELFSCGNPAISVSAVRRTPDGILVRLYDSLGSGARTTLSGGLLQRGKLYTATMEGVPGEEISPENLKFKPFEIRTFNIK